MISEGCHNELHEQLSTFQSNVADAVAAVESATASETTAQTNLNEKNVECTTLYQEKVSLLNERAQLSKEKQELQDNMNNLISLSTHLGNLRSQCVTERDAYSACQPTDNCNADENRIQMHIRLAEAKALELANAINAAQSTITTYGHVATETNRLQATDASATNAAGSTSTTRRRLQKMLGISNK